MTYYIFNTIHSTINTHNRLENYWDCRNIVMAWFCCLCFFCVSVDWWGNLLNFCFKLIEHPVHLSEDLTCHSELDHPELCAIVWNSVDDWNWIIWNVAGWWFGTCGLFFHSVWNHNPNWLIFFQRGCNRQPVLFQIWSFETSSFNLREAIWNSMIFSSCSWDLCLVETGGNPNIPKSLFS